MKFYHCFFFLIYTILITINTQNIFDPTTFQSLNRLSSPILSPDGLYVVYTVRKWNKTAGKSATNIQCSKISDKSSFNIT